MRFGSVSGTSVSLGVAPTRSVCQAPKHVLPRKMERSIIVIGVIDFSEHIRKYDLLNLRVKFHGQEDFIQWMARSGVSGLVSEPEVVGLLHSCVLPSELVISVDKIKDGGRYYIMQLHANTA